MISAKLIHEVFNQLHMILGYIELAEVEEDPAERKNHFNRARAEMRSLTTFLKENKEKEKRKTARKIKP